MDSLTVGLQDLLFNACVYPLVPSSFVTITLSGEGAYEGLTAVVLVNRLRNPYTIEGAVIAGDPVPAPEPPAE